MFIQVIQGPISDEAELQASLQAWLDNLAAGAHGWLGGTYGVTDDGHFVAVVRFASEEDANRSSERPEQGEWWANMERLFTGEVSFTNYSDVMQLLDGGSDEAGFVQVMQGRVTDIEAARRLNDEGADVLRQYRPDIIGATIGVDADGGFTQTVAFTTEAAAREGESQELPAEVGAMMAQWDVLLQDVTFIDLHHPWFASAGN